MSLRPRKKPEDENSGAGEAKDAEKAAPKLSLKPKSTEQPAAGEATAQERPKLSLKPKTKPAETAAPAPAAETAPEPPAAEPRAKPKLSIKTETEPVVETAAPEPAPTEEPAPSRPKPKLAMAPKEPGEETPAAPESTPPTPPAAPVETHRDETNPGIDPAVKEALKRAKSEKPKLKLTVSKATAPTETPAADALPQQSSGFVGDAPTPAPSTASPEADPTLPPPLPVVTDGEADPATTPPLPPPSQLADDGDDDDDSEAPARKRLRPEQRPLFKIAVIAVVVLVLGGVAFGGYLVYNMFFAAPELNPYAAPLQAISEPPPAEEPASVAGQLIEQAQEAVAAHEEGVEAADEAAEVPAETPAATSPTVTLDLSDAPATPSVIEPSAAFRDWVNNVVISGVAETSNPRAFINGVLVKRGDTVDHGLGIVFDDVDPDENLVLFKDPTGAVVGKRY